MDAFVSHSSRDLSLVLTIEEALSDLGLEVWVDKDNLRAGGLLIDELQDAITDAETLVLCWSAPAASSRWVSAEWQAAFHLDKKIIPCLVDGTPLPPFLLRYLHCDFQGSFGNAIACLSSGLLGSRRAGVAPAPEEEVDRGIPTGRNELVHLLSDGQQGVLAAIGAGRLELAGRLQEELDPTCERAVVGFPGDALLLNMAGYHRKNAYLIRHFEEMRSGRFPVDTSLEEAEQLFLRSLSVQPDNAYALNGIGNVLFFERDLAAAEFYISSALKQARSQRLQTESIEHDLALVRSHRAREDRPRLAPARAVEEAPTGRGRTAPVVDVHCHVFSIREIPFEGYLRARFHDEPFGRDVLVPILAELLREYLRHVDTVGLEETGPDPERDLQRTILRLAEQDPRFRKRVVKLGLIHDPRVLENVWKAGHRGMKPPRAPLTMAGIGNMAWLFVQDQRTIFQRLLRTYPGTDLFTPLMMDMWKWFADPETCSPRRQMEDLAELVLQSGGRLHPVVAFDPRRQAEDGTSLTLVRDAIEKHGFVGVKLYPPMGYRPTSNDTTLGADGRPYGRAGEDYDRALRRLYEYCDETDVPITVHTALGGAEAHDGSGEYSDPRYWKPVLQRHPRLRINFAHFGGYWHLAHRSLGWAKTIVDLMDQYSNVYADTGFHLVFNPRQRPRNRRYFDHLGTIFEQRPASRGRILYGSDWHMYVALKHTDRYQDRFRTVFMRRFGATRSADFMGHNALDFLGLTDGKNRARLASFYRGHGLFDLQRTFPPWWR